MLDSGIVTARIAESIARFDKEDSPSYIENRSDQHDAQSQQTLRPGMCTSRGNQLSRHRPDRVSHRVCVGPVLRARLPAPWLICQHQFFAHQSYSLPPGLPVDILPVLKGVGMKTLPFHRACTVGRSFHLVVYAGESMLRRAAQELVIPVVPTVMVPGGK